jgi:GT2 family glycosyltransferase
MGRRVSVVLVTWNSARYLARCLEALSRQTHPSIELIVVDNASTDESVTLAEPQATRTIRNPANLGFSVAVNQAIAVSSGEFVMLLNPDARLEPSYIATLVDAFDALDPRFGMATGKLLRATGDDIAPAQGIDSLGMRMTRNGRHLDIEDEHFLRVLKPELGIHEVFGVSGAAAMFRRTFLQDVAIAGEIFDEDFFAYREDADLAWRGRLFGWRAFCATTAVAYHVRRVTPEVREQLPASINMHSVKNRFLLRAKNEGLGLALRNAPFELSRDLTVLAACLMVERTSLPAFSWLWRNRSRVFAKRREIQRRRIISDRALAEWFA